LISENYFLSVLVSWWLSFSPQRHREHGGHSVISLREYGLAKRGLFFLSVYLCVLCDELLSFTTERKIY
ncbi:MAG TPA: hypothetical protein P5050_06055, partial [Bacteroidia bacterium]|nr:hypothetical protein [Bacteroidia bacterium]